MNPPPDILKTLQDLTQDEAFWAKREAEIKAMEAEDARKAKEAAAALKLKRWMEIPKTYREDFDRAKCNIPKEVVDYVSKWMPENEKGIGLIGTTGLGKTRLLVRLLKKLGCGWLFMPMTRYAAFVREQYDDDYGVANVAYQTLKECRKVKVLLLDDIGQESPTEAVSEALLDLIEYRTSHGKKLLWTSNTINSDEMARRHKGRGAAIVRRLSEFCWIP